MDASASSLLLRAPQRSGVVRTIHERGGRIAIAIVVGATTFSLRAQGPAGGIPCRRRGPGLGGSTPA